MTVLDLSARGKPRQLKPAPDHGIRRSLAKSLSVKDLPIQAGNVPC